LLGDDLPQPDLPDGAGDPGEKRERPPGRWSRDARGLTIGIEMVACIGVGTALGAYVDTRIRAETPWGMIVGFCLGTAAAFRSLMSLTRE